MATIAVEASTVAEYQAFPVQENPEIATQSSGIFLPSAIPVNYVYSINREVESATTFFTSSIRQKALSFLPAELIYEQVMLVTGRFYSMQPHMQIQISSHHEVFDTVSTYTAQISVGDPQLEQGVRNIFDAYQHEEFDTDIAYDFTNALDRLIRANGKPAILIINHLIQELNLNKDLISETLRALGRIEDENTKEERYQLLMGFIKNDSAIIRDGAVSGLSFLDDRRALPQLRMLFETEAVPILKNNIKVAIRGLETY